MPGESDQSKSRFLLVTPVWKDSSRLAEFGAKLAESLSSGPHDVDWIIADDGSGPDECRRLEELHEKLAKTYGRVSVHFAGDHRGKGAVVREAWSLDPEARWLAFVDADGSLSPGELTRMMDVAVEGGRTVLAIRKRTETTHVDLTLFRRIAHKLFILAVRILVGVRCSDPQCGAKILLGDDYRPVADSLRESGLAFDTEMLAALSENSVQWTELPVTWIEKHGGKVRPMRDAWGMLGALWQIRIRQKRGDFAG